MGGGDHKKTTINEPFSPANAGRRSSARIHRAAFRAAWAASAAWAAPRLKKSRPRSEV